MNHKDIYHSLFINTFILVLILSYGNAHAQKDKIIAISKGETNVITGRIKLMDKNTLTMTTDYSKGDFKIAWSSVKKIFSKRLFLITLNNGTVLNASINSDTTTNDGGILLWHFDAEDTVKQNQIVYIKAIEKDFWSRLNASLSLGYSLIKQNNLQQFSLRSNIGYLSNFWSFQGSLDALRTSQEDREDLGRTNANLTFEYFLQHNFFLLLSSNFLQNDEQRLELRAATRAGIGNYLLRTNKFYLSASTGGVWNNEQYTGDGLQNRNSVELFVGTEANLYNIGNLNLLTSVIVYPSLTENDRRRTDFRFDVRYNLPLNFFIKFGYTLNYDNKPVEGAVKNDYVLQTTLGWSL